MKKLVTGSTGFIGSAITRELLKDGTDVKVLIRETSDTRNINNLDVERVYGDIRDSDSMKRALKGCDTLYFTAAYFAHWAPNPKLLYEVNVGGTKASLKAALESGVEKVVYTSTNNAIAASGPVPADEERPLITGKPAITIPCPNISRRTRRGFLSPEGCRWSWSTPPWSSGPMTSNRPRRTNDHRCCQPENARIH